MKINVQKLYSLDGHRDCVYALEGGKANNLFFSAGGEGYVVIWDLDKPEMGQLLVNMKNSVYTLKYLKEENILIVGQNFEGIHLINPEEKKEIGSLKISNAQIFDLKTGDRRLFIGSGDGILYIADLDNLAFIKKLKLSEKSIRTIAVNTTLGELAVGLSDNSIRILDLVDYRQKYMINAHKLSVFSITYNPINNHLISTSRDAYIKTWDSLDHYKMDKSIVAHMFAINSLSISPDNKYFVTGSMDKSVKVWDLNTFQLLKVIDSSRHAGHTTSVNKVLWTTYNNLVLSAGDDRKISVWDLSFI